MVPSPHPGNLHCHLFCSAMGQGEGGGGCSKGGHTLCGVLLSAATTEEGGWALLCAGCSLPWGQGAVWVCWHLAVAPGPYAP